MDIDEFYDADPRRRDSDEEDFGVQWQDPHDPDDLWSLHWVKETGELYRMREPKRTWFPGMNLERKVKDRDLTVEVIGRVPGQDDLRRVLGDWERLMRDPDGLKTVVARLGADGHEG